MLKQGIVALVAVCCAPFMSSVQAADLRIETEGGLAKGAEIIHVTTLADTGSGSLRAALLSRSPRVIVFDVAGYIELTRDLDLNAGNVTIAGETAPSGGIVIRGGGLKIRASNVLIGHIAIYPGSNSDPKIAETRDAITIYGSKSRNNILRNVVLRNVSAGWGVDENVGVQGLVDGLRIERSLIAEALLKGGHPKGRHSMNVLLAQSVGQAFMARNIFAAGDQRNPRLTNGNSAAVVNNLIVAFGAAATHIDLSTETSVAATIDIIGNAYRPAKLSNCRNSFILMAKDFFAGSPDSKIFLNDNSELANPEKSCKDKHAPGVPDRGSFATGANFDLSWYKITDSASLYPAILNEAGSHPASRNPIDARIIAAIRDHTIRLVDNVEDAGGWPAIEPVERKAELPIAHDTIKTDSDLRLMRQWLEEQRAAASGTSTLPN